MDAGRQDSRLDVTVVAGKSRSARVLRSDDTEARHNQGEQATARERLQASSCRPAMMDVINLAGELRNSIETG